MVSILLLLILVLNHESRNITKSKEATNEIGHLKEDPWDIILQPSDDSISVIITKHFSTSTNKCFGFLRNVETSINVFNCSEDINCSSCQDFNITSLSANTKFEFFIETSKPYFNKTEIVITTFHFSSAFYPDYRFVNVQISKSHGLKAECSGTVVNVVTGELVYLCKNRRDCKACSSFFVYRLLQNTKYYFNITSTLPNTVIKGTVVTLEFLAFQVIPTNSTFTVLVKKSLPKDITCTGGLFSKFEGKYVFDCDENKQCKTCSDFNITGLFPDKFYVFNIISSFQRIGFYETRKTLYTFYLKTNATHHTIEIAIIKVFSSFIFCTGNVYKMKTMESVFNCSSNENCSKCGTFNVTKLESGTEYIIKIYGSSQNASFITNVTTLNYDLWNFSLRIYDNSVDVFFMTRYPINLLCSGYLWNLQENISVFDCSTNENCRKCRSFNILELYSNTKYMLEINLVKSQIIKSKTFITSYHILPIFSSNYTSIVVFIDRSPYLEATCYGKVYNKKTGVEVFDCKKNFYCYMCLNFTVFNLEPNTKYTFDLTSIPTTSYVSEDSTTLEFWKITTSAKFNSIYVSINKFSSLYIECCGFLLDENNNKIFDCSHDENCKKCDSFDIVGLLPKRSYLINLTTNFPTLKFQKNIKLDDLFSIKTTMSFFSLSVESTKLYNIETYCSGNITEHKSGIQVFSCNKSSKCSSCESFEVDGLTQNTKYTLLIYLNSTYIFLNEFVTTEAVWFPKVLSTTETITVYFNTVFHKTMTCDGTISEIDKGGLTIFNCSTDKYCSKCKDFVIDKLNYKTQYKIDITSNINNAIINEIIETNNLIQIVYTSEFDAIRYSFVVSYRFTSSCSVYIYQNITSNLVFNCTSNSDCFKCASSLVTNLTSNTLYTIYVNTDDAKTNLIRFVKTGKFEFKIKMIKIHPTSVDIHLIPLYKSQKNCIFYLYDENKKSINMTCLNQCPNKCDVLNFTLINLQISSFYSLVIKSANSMRDEFELPFYTNSIEYTLDLININNSSFEFVPYANTTSKTNDSVCIFTIENLQTTSISYVTNNCTPVKVFDIIQGNIYKIDVNASLSSLITKSLLVNTLPTEPKDVKLFQYNNTALLIEAKVDINQRPPINFLVKASDYEIKYINLTDQNSNLVNSTILTTHYIKVKTTINIIPRIIYNIGVCTAIEKPLCHSKNSEFCESCVYTRFPIFYISFFYAGEPTLVKAENSTSKLMITLPAFNPNNKFTSKCEIYLVKLLNLNTLPLFLPNNFDIFVGKYNGNYWILSYQSYNYSLCKILSNVTFDNSEDNNNNNLLNTQFITDSIYYAGVFYLCRHNTCTSSRVSNIIFLLNQNKYILQLVLLLISLILMALLMGLIVAILVLRNRKIIQSGYYKVKVIELPVENNNCKEFTIKKVEKFF